ncbi:MAG: methyltransferase [Planctomycetota bacterium]
MAQKPFFDLERIDPDGLRRVAGVLRGAGYTERGARERLGLKDISELRLNDYPYYQLRSLRHRGPLELAIALFLLQGSVTEEELGQLFDANARKVLREAGILVGERASRTWRSRVSIYPVGEERLFATDHRFTDHDPWLAARVPREPVMYLGADSYYLARTTLHRPIRAALDLCTGSGVHGILAAAHAERTVGVDVNSRAVNFARLNAVLNDAWNAVFLEGDLFTPVGNERFDLIVANPPFVPSPVYELAYRDGGPSGADVLRRIVSAIPDHLQSGGIAQVVTHVAERDGESYLDRIRRWTGGANMHLHSVRLGEEDIVDYAVSQTKRAFGERYPRYQKQLMDWVTNLRSQRFKRVLGVILTLSWNEEAPKPPWTQEDESKPPREPLAPELSRLMAAKKRARSIPSLADLDALRVGIPDDILLTERRRPTGTGFETKDFRVVFKNAKLSPELDIKPLVRDLLERVDNRSTVPQVISRLASDLGQNLAELDERCRRAFLVMFERGLVTLDEVNGAAPAPTPPVIHVTPRPRGPSPADSREASAQPEPDLASSQDGEQARPSRRDEHEKTVVERTRHDTPPEED